MNKLKFLEERVAELEERGQVKSENFSLSTVGKSEPIRRTLVVGDKIKLYSATPKRTGSVFLTSSLEIQSLAEANISLLFTVGDKVIGEISKSLNAGKNEVLFFGGCRIFGGVESEVGVCVQSFSTGATIVLNNYSVNMVGIDLESAKNTARISGDKNGNKLLLVLSDAKNIYYYYSEDGILPRVKSDFSLYGAGYFAVGILETTENGVKPRIFRLAKSGSAFLSSGLNISTEEIVAENVLDIAIGETESGVVAFYIKNNNVYYKIFDGVNSSVEKQLASGNKFKFSEIGTAGRGKNLTVVATSLTGGNYIYFQIANEFEFESRAEHIVLKIIPTISES